MKKKFISILNATGIHMHGGISILDNFLKFNFSKYLIDSRSDYIKLKKLNNVSLIKNSFYERFRNELKLKKNENENTKVIYLGGLPPMFNSKSLTITCFQNANIFPEFYNNSKKLNWLLSRDFIRYIYFSLFKKNSDIWVVFSPISKMILVNNNISEYKIKQINIFNKINKKTLNTKKIYDFIYPASFKPHKNHKNLLNALVILAKKHLRPSVLLTLTPAEQRLLNTDYLIKKYDLKLFFYHTKNTNNFIKIYDKCKSLIYPSLNETIGLPIIEAKQKNLLLACSNKPYSYQFYKPDYKFNPYNPDDIASVMIKIICNNFKVLKKKSNEQQLDYKNDILNFKDMFI